MSPSGHPPNVASVSALQHRHPTDTYTQSQHDSLVPMENGQLNPRPGPSANVYSDQYHGQVNGSIVGGVSSVNHLQNIHVDVHVVNSPYPTNPTVHVSTSPTSPPSSYQQQHMITDSAITESPKPKSQSVRRKLSSLLLKRPSSSRGPDTISANQPQIVRCNTTSANGHERIPQNDPGTTHPGPVYEHHERPTLLLSGQPERPDKRSWFSRLKTKSNPASPITPPSLSPLNGSGMFPVSPTHPHLDEEQMAIFLRQSIDDLEPFVHESSDGAVIGGTLVGLVERLISDFPDVPQNTEYRDVFFSTFVVWTDSETIFRLLVQKYRKAESLAIEAQEKIRFNVVAVMQHWVAIPHVLVDMEVLLQMKKFATSLAETSISMAELAGKVKERVDIRINAERSNSMSSATLQHRAPDPSNITPRQLAMALTVLEGERYRTLFPADYIRHLVQSSSLNNVTAAADTHNQILLWVKMSVLMPTQYKVRAEVFKFFINTALECRKLGNLSSMVAIVTALQSSSVSRLSVTREEVKQPALRDLANMESLIVNVPRNKLYTEALRKSSNSCVPWIAVHLLELRDVLRRHPSIVKVDGRHLINFKRSVEITHWIRRLLKHKPPSLSRPDVAAPLAYLEGQLAYITMTPSVEDDLERRSIFFSEDEKEVHSRRIREFESLGLRI